MPTEHTLRKSKLRRKEATKAYYVICWTSVGLSKLTDFSCNICQSGILRNVLVFKYSRWLGHTANRELAVLSMISNEVNEPVHLSYGCKTIWSFLRSIIKLHYCLELVKRFKTEEVVLDLSKRTRGATSPVSEVNILY